MIPDLWDFWGMTEPSKSKLSLPGSALLWREGNQGKHRRDYSDCSDSEESNARTEFSFSLAHAALSDIRSCDSKRRPSHAHQTSVTPAAIAGVRFFA
jgi:hypothetical protein